MLNRILNSVEMEGAVGIIFKTWCFLNIMYAVKQAVYGTLFEAEHRSTFYIPYWKLPFARWIVPRQRKFHNDLNVINACLDGLIRNAKETRQVSNSAFKIWCAPHLVSFFFGLIFESILQVVIYKENEKRSRTPFVRSHHLGRVSMNRHMIDSLQKRRTQLVIA